MVTSLPKKTEFPVVHIHSVMNPLWPTPFPTGCRRFLGYTDCKPRHSWHTPSMLSALFSSFPHFWHVVNQVQCLDPIPWTDNGFKRQEKSLELIWSQISSDFLQIAFLITAEVNIFLLARSTPNTHWDIELLILMAPSTNSTYSLILEMEKKIITYPA